MQAVYILVALMAVAASARPDAPLLPRGIIPVLSRSETRDSVGQFALSYLTGDGITFTEQGALKPTLDRKDNVLVKQGSYSYTAPDGQLITLTYVADEQGFRPVGRHLPVPVVAIPATF